MKTILIVDDSATIRKLLAYILKRKNYVIAEAEDGIDAMEKLSHVQVDLVIVDLNMPNMDGIEFVKNLRDNYYYMDTACHPCSRQQKMTSLKKTLLCRCQHVLKQPVQPNFLLYKVESLLQDEEEFNG